MSSKKLEELQGEIQQKIGKNFLLFQKIEMLLKHLISINNASGYHNEIAQIIQDKKQKVYKNTMGGLVTQLQKDCDLEVENNYHDDLGELSTVHFAFQFRIRDTSLYDNLILIRDERNRLTHHFLSDWNMSTIDQCQNVIEHLNQQYQLAQSVMEKLIDYVKFIDESAKLLCNVIIAELVKDSIIEKLIDINKQKNNNGWTSLTFAAQRLSQDIPREDINKLNYTYNCGNLRDFMLKTNVFDIDDKKTAKGTKTTYRIKSDINLDNLSILMPELVVGINQFYRLQPDSC
jgi:hypothetical protein